MNFVKSLFSTVTFTGTILATTAIFISPSFAQPITPSLDGTGTLITPHNNQINITGGTLSGDGANLFHSFTQFNLSENQIANFTSNPNILNILGRINGGNPSYINGLIQITGGNSNLFLMNPAGIMFGQNASLNVPASFTVTTATGIGFTNGFFNAFGNNNYTALVGTPSGFNFAVSQPGSIVNTGNLSLNPGNNLTLIGGNVINTGTLSSPGGNLTISSIPGNNSVKISQTGHLLSLEITPTTENTGINPLRLPQLLTGANFGEQANSLTVNEKGEVILSNNVKIPTTQPTSIASGNIDASSQTQGGTVNILGTNVAVIDAQINASGNYGAGTILIGGDYRGLGTVPNAFNTFVSKNSTINADSLSIGNGGKVIVWADNTTQFYGNINARGNTAGGFVEISGKQNLIFRGNVDLSAQNGNTGTLLLDPENIVIVPGSGAPEDSEIADGEILFSEGTGTFTISQNALESLSGTANIKLEATNDITIEPLTDGKLTFAPGTGTVTFTADADIDGVGSFTMNSTDTIRAEGRNISINAASITAGNIDTSSVNNGGEINLNTSNGAGDITTANINSYSEGAGAGGTVTLNAGGALQTGGIKASSILGNGGQININAGENINAASIDSSSTQGSAGGNITVNSNNGSLTTHITTSANEGNSGAISIDVAGDLNNSSFSSNSSMGNGGNINLTSRNGGINNTNISSYSWANQGGNINVNVAGDINSDTTGYSYFWSNGNLQGGNINITSQQGSIDAANIEINSLSGSGASGNISITAQNSLKTGNIITYAETIAGNVTLTSINGNVDTSNGIIDTYSTSGQHGKLLINANTGSILLGNIYQNINLVDGGSDNPFINTSSGNISSDTSTINNATGQVSLSAHNDITISEPIISSTISSLELRAGRSININANIDTSAAAGNISLLANNDALFFTRRDPGPGNITMAAGTSLNAGSGNINLQLGNLGEIGNITLNNLNTTGSVSINANGGNILQTDSNSLINANTATFETRNVGGIGSEASPLQININNLEAKTDYGGVFLYSPTQGITIGGASNSLEGIRSLRKGDISLKAAGDINITEAINTDFSRGNSGNISLTSTDGSINISNFISTRGGNINITASDKIDASGYSISSYTFFGKTGDVALHAGGDIQVSVIDNSSDDGTAGSISLTSDTGNINTNIPLINNEGSPALTSFSSNANGGNITLSAPAGNITTGSLSLYGYLRAGNVNISAGNVNINSGGIINASQDILSYSDIGIGGDVTLQSTGNINTNNIRTEGPTQSGNVSIISNNGAITTSAIETLAPNGTAGNITLNTFTTSGNITTTNITSSGSQGSGNIIIDSANNVFSTTVSSNSNNGNSGDVIVNADEDVNTGDVSSNGGNNSGDVSVNAGNNANTGNVSSTANDGNSGNTTVTAGNEINAGDISSNATDNSGNTTVAAGNNANLGDVSSTSNTGTSGNTTVTAGNDINAGNISTAGNINSGNVTVNSGGDIKTDIISSNANQGTAGNILVDAVNNIQTDNILTSSNSGGGDITVNAGNNANTGNISITSQQGNSGNATINTGNNANTGNISITSQQGNSGNATVNAGNDANIGNISTTSQQGDSGNATVNAGNNANTGNISIISQQGNSGNAAINAGGNIQTGDINSTGNTGSGNISLTSENGTLTAGNLSSVSTEGNSGNINVAAQGNTTTGNILSSGRTDSGDISVTSQQGTVTTNNITSISTEQNSGNITVEAAQNVTTGNISSIGEQNSGNITVTSREGAVNTGDIQSLANLGEAGQIALSSKTGITTGTVISRGNQNSTILQTDNQNSELKPEKVFASKVENSNNNTANNLLNGLANPNRNNNQIATNTNQIIEQIERNRTEEYTNYFGQDIATQPVTTDNIRNILSKIAATTGTRSGIIYVTTLDNELELILFTPEGEPVRRTIPGVDKENLLITVLNFRLFLTDPLRRNNSYLPSSKQLYTWLISPIEAELQNQKINNILFSMDSGLRGLPIAALHDGKQFLIEKYSIGLIPSVSLMDSRYQSIQNSPVLAMGASEFQTLSPLPSVPVELAIITQQQGGKVFLNEGFTRENIQTQRQNNPYQIVHFATHAEFIADDIHNSFMQLWDEQLPLNDLRQLRLNQPQVQLLVLSACRTAVGDEKAELGFAGLAVRTGVKSALASLWYVSDQGTLGLMSEFYKNLENVPIKAEALRQAQLAMLRGQVGIQNKNLQPTDASENNLSTSFKIQQNLDLSHPYFWSGFTMIGSPW
ncbi:CHAT domain-containing protein [Ancylothrix sp. C2]|uniref:CHAT domain-containing protein n=1 Tax=Ancylothrix sp. D3o TaxID=2953691 RepID=UPI0021BBA938|nr:CHAT domain-containing protein [Ancylothrix sp. D3o]MCT7951688.1 CHAT domain-containing protein [Ancylothrix sp. D3o]